ncbi:hypothetical protein GCM10009680_75430 [Streptomyces yatensis]|uniref:Uncharacterized protein n=1 Tax=Streptomyces yatensis TaxID=155177 RepID=A0ABP4VIL2_9ACTN
MAQQKKKWDQPKCGAPLKYRRGRCKQPAQIGRTWCADHPPAWTKEGVAKRKAEEAKRARKR